MEKDKTKHAILITRKEIEKREEERKKQKKNLIINLVLSIIIAVVTYIVSRKIISSLIAFAVVIILAEASLFIKEFMKKSVRIKKMEEVFPDFIELMASNLRAGMTIDRALLLSSRKEFAPLDEEILNLGKDIITGKEINTALTAMAARIKSDKITKTITVINSGIRSGGNLAIILEETAVNMRERSFIEKRAASNVLMYIIFIFFAVAAGAPALFSLSSVLVQILTSILGDIPQIDTSAATSLPFTLTSIDISPEFVMYFSLIFLIAIDIMASLLLGLVNKGEEKAGLKYAIPLILLSMVVFFTVRFFLTSYFSDLIG